MLNSAEHEILDVHKYKNIKKFGFFRLRGLVDRKLVEATPPPPVIFIAGRLKAALLFWFFGDFRCGALLFMVIHVIYKYKNSY